MAGNRTIYVERNVTDSLFGSGDRMFNYWAPVRNKWNEIVGVGGLQFTSKDIEALLPQSLF